jgi:hypothetical protein
MKNFKLFMFLLLLPFAGCFTDSSVSPEFGILADKNSVDWIQLDGLNSIQLDKEAAVVQEINGSTGGTIEYNLKVANLNVNGTLTVPENSFNGTMDISAVFNNRSTTQTFGPSPFTFENTLLLTLEYSGLNLKKIDPSQIDFYYIDNEGQFHKAVYSSITVDVEAGILKVVEAKINHFSRWGWAK